MVKFTGADAAALGLESAALAEAPELLRSAFRALASQIQSCDESHPKWALRCGGKAAAAELESLKTSVHHVWFVSAGGAYKALAQQARDVTYFIQDLQDMIEYRRLQTTLAPRINILSHHIKRLRCPWNRSRTDRFIRDIRAVNEETRRLGSLLDKAQCQLPRPDSVRTTHRTVVFGRHKERDDIVQMLVQQPCREDAAPEPEMIISVTGAGGIGKTTLAQMVFNDARVAQHFDVRFWVSVSTCSNKMQLAAEILRSAHPAWDGSDEKKKTVDFEMLQSELRRFVAAKRCLIVLDDVCGSTDEILQEILTPLQSADIRSRILVTSRMPHMMGASQMYTVNPLGSDDCWSLLKEHALPSDAGDVHPDLQHIGREIAAKTNGSPLSLKLVGGVLGATRSKGHWMNIRDIGLQDDTALQLSYKHLPGHLKRCFAYCSLFPQDYKFDPAHLSRLWIAEGFVDSRCKPEKRMEDIAREYFDQLLARSFFQEIKLGQKMYYVVHDLLHHLAKSVAAEDCFRVEDGIKCDIPSTVRHLSVPVNSLPGLANFSGLEDLRTLLVQRSVPSSTSCFQQDIAVNLKCLLEKSKHLRVLDLSSLNLEELPLCIDGLLGLRYLSIHGSIQRLPESIGKLLHLQTLCFTGKCYLEKLPASISMLVNLRHLVVETKYTAGLTGIGRLANLQGSLELHVEKREGLKVEELRDINGLRGLLKIKGLENVSSYEEACKAELNNKPYLHSLNLEWSSASTNNSLPADAKVLEGLQPHQDIKVLNIRRFRGAKAPSWLQSLQQLHSLYLTNCRSLVMLPPLGLLGSLKYLHMKEMCAVDRIGHEFYGTGDVAFPSLSFLKLDDFPRLHDWSGIADRKSFPCLERLIIMDCPELGQIPPFFPITREVTIERTRLIPYMRLAPFSSISEKFQLDLFTTSVNFGGLLSKQHIEAIAALNISGAEEVIVTEEIESLVSLRTLQLRQCNVTDQNFSRFLQALPCLSSLELSDLPNVTSLPASETLRFSIVLTALSIRNCQFFQCLSSLQFFGSLKDLVLERCTKVTAASFPLNFRSLPSLKVLRISYCSELQSLPVCGLPSSLETLHIIGCHQELSRQSRNRKGHYFEKLAVVPNLRIQ
ncbi:putative disease resistance protein RGA3 [Lolium rigidum]|uniref:putative disease resistance protein RGA3 n=1 Tax=Lolium rigidum TaxID=89674 RepID=UPI001F5D4A22|nr:putative disease resistance protein RGA3 [Lolium rigidum]